MFTSISKEEDVVSIVDFEFPLRELLSEHRGGFSVQQDGDPGIRASNEADS